MAKRRFTFKRIALTCGALFLFMVAWIAISLFWPVPPIRISKETTFVTGPLNADGMVDFVAAIEELHFADVTNENNAAVEYVQVINADEFN